jgi:hypothetical protein
MTGAILQKTPDHWAIVVPLSLAGPSGHMANVYAVIDTG